MRYLYIGPSKPYDTPLRHNQILSVEDPGSIWPAVAEVIEAHPELKKLIVPADKVAAARAQLAQTGSVINRAAEAVKADIAAAKAAAKKEG